MSDEICRDRGFMNAIEEIERQNFAIKSYEIQANRDALELDRLRRELEDARIAYDTLAEAYTERKRELAEARRLLEAEITRHRETGAHLIQAQADLHDARRSLVVYGMHASTCYWRPCTCGFTDAWQKANDALLVAEESK